MSHTVRIVPKLLDVAAMRAAAARMGFSELEVGLFPLGDRIIRGVQIHLPGSHGSLLCDVETGELLGRSLGVASQLTWNRFLQAYAIEKVRIEACRLGVAILEEPHANGTVRLTIIWRDQSCDDLS